MEYLINLLIFIAIYAILGVSLNLVVGYTGLLSVAHAAFYGVGAYAVALLAVFFGLNFFVALAAGCALAALLAFLLALVLSRFQGDYYALGSMGFNAIVFAVLLNWDTLTRGPLGIPGIPRPELFGFSFASNQSFLFLALACLVLVYVSARFVVRSSFGRALMAIREDEEALEVFGYNTRHFKLAVFVIGAAMAAAAGALFASYITFIDPTTFTINESVFILAIIIFGGLGSLPGSVAGAAGLVMLPELMRFVGFPGDIAAQMRQALYGVILVLLMLYRPKGLIGEYGL